MLRQVEPRESGADTIAVIGAGLIGLSWSALFAATGRRVLIFDSFANPKAAMDEFWNKVSPALAELGLLKIKGAPDIAVASTLGEAVRSADFVQECIPERLELKKTLYAEMEGLLKPGAIAATSSSGLKLSDLQAAWRDPGRIIIAHPFNPPHLVPLVELYGNEKTAEGVLQSAGALYKDCGKVTITLKREVMGHVANRLQAALWREAISLVADGVASLKDVNTAVHAGPGLRWSIMGPHLLLNLGGGPGGLRAYCEQFRDSYHEWWDDMGRPMLTPDVIDTLVVGLSEELGGRSYEDLRNERDKKLVAVQRAIRSVDDLSEQPSSVPLNSFKREAT